MKKPARNAGTSKGGIMAIYRLSVSSGTDLIREAWNALEPHGQSECGFVDGGRGVRSVIFASAP